MGSSPVAVTLKYNSINKKNKKKNDEIIFSAKSELNSIEVLICKALLDSNISHDEFILINNEEQKASWLLTSLGIRTPLNKIPLLGPLLF